MPFEWNSLTIEVADAFKEELLSFVGSNEEDVSLDLSEVNKIDLTGIQLILSLKKSLEQHGKTLLISTYSENVKKAFTLCGCEEILEG